MEHIIDASNQKLGRLASRISVVLQGKISASYEPRLSGSERVIVKNAGRIVVTGRKSKNKIYYRHTGYMGHLKEKTFREAFEQSPEQVLRRAVYNMLPKNRLRAKRLRRLVIER